MCCSVVRVPNDRHISNQNPGWPSTQSNTSRSPKASFSSDRWPVAEVTDPDGSLRFVLKDGSKLPRIEPPLEVYDYDAGKSIGRVGLRRIRANQESKRRC